MKKRVSRVGAAALAFASAVALAACSPAVREVGGQSDPVSGDSQSGAQSGESREPKLDESRIRRIVRDVQEVLDRAQTEKDREILTERLTGGALSLRQAQFVQAEKTGTELDPLEIEINVASATAADSWPRVLLVGSSAAPDDPAEVFLFTQETAQSDYMLENWVRAVGGNSVRGVAVEAGTEALPPDATGFRLTPAEALQTYVNFLNDPGNAEHQVFDDKTFAPRYASDLTALNDAVAKAGSVSANAAVAEYPLTAVSLVTGEALVSASFTYTHTYKRTVARSTMSVGGTPAAYLTDANVVGTVTVTYLVNTFFTLPPKDSTDPIRIVGSERVLVGATKDDAAIPEGE